MKLIVRDEDGGYQKGVFFTWTNVGQGMAAVVAIGKQFHIVPIGRLELEEDVDAVFAKPSPEFEEYKKQMEEFKEILLELVAKEKERENDDNA